MRDIVAIIESRIVSLGVNRNLATTCMCAGDHCLCIRERPTHTPHWYIASLVRIIWCTRISGCGLGACNAIGGAMLNVVSVHVRATYARNTADLRAFSAGLHTSCSVADTHNMGKACKVVGVHAVWCVCSCEK